MQPLNPLPPLAPHLQPGESLAWQQQPGPAPLTRSESRALLKFGLLAGVIGTTLAGLAEVSTALLPLVFAGITAVVYGYRRFTERPSPERLYAVTEGRVLIVEGRRVRSFEPDDIGHVEVEVLDDGSVDLVWGNDRGSVSTPTQHNTGWTARASFVAAQRSHKRGFIGLPAAEPALGQIQRLLQRQQQKAADAVPLSPPAMSGGLAAGGAGTSTGPRWRTVRQQALGFAIDLPADWLIKTATVKRIQLLGFIPFEPEPRWSTSASGPWNRLVVDTGTATVALQVSLNPAGFPARFDDTVNERLNKLLNLSTIAQSLDTHLGAFRGFSVVQDLEGVGLSVSLGPVKVNGASAQARMMQKQAWVRSDGLAVHLQYVAPKDDTALHAALDRVVATIRVEH